jgi:sugar phosphate isomerase/epimerase
MLKNYRGRFPFKLATTSYIYPDEIVPNVVRLGPFFDEIELVLFESGRQDSIPDDRQISRLIDLSLSHRVGFNIHLPIDISLGDENEKVRATGVSVVRRVVQKTLRLNPSFYVLHLDFINPPRPLPRNCVAMSLRGSEATEAILQGIRNKEIATLSSFARNDKKGITTWSLKRKQGVSIQEKDIEAWRRRVSRSLKEILNNGIEAKRISIETLGYPFEWIEDLVREFGFSICLDIGHILTRGYDLRHYLETYLPSTSIVHLHGSHNGSDHLGIETLPEPDLDLLLSSLHHYHGIVSIEVFSINELKNSLSILEEKWIKS